MKKKIFANYKFYLAGVILSVLVCTIVWYAVNHPYIKKNIRTSTVEYTDGYRIDGSTYIPDEEQKVHSEEPYLLISPGKEKYVNHVEMILSEPLGENIVHATANQTTAIHAEAVIDDKQQTEAKTTFSPDGRVITITMPLDCYQKIRIFIDAPFTLSKITNCNYYENELYRLSNRIGFGMLLVLLLIATWILLIPVMFIIYQLPNTAIRFKRRLEGFWAYKDLLRELVTRDLKLKYRRSFLGYVWSVLNPLLTMVVLVIVFSSMFQRNIPNFPVYLLCGQTLFNFMKQSTDFAMGSITGNAALLKKVYVPKYIFTLAKITSGLVDLIFSLGALLIVMLVTGTPFTVYLLLIPFVLLELYIFVIGLGMFLAQFSVFFRDINYIYNVATTAWMYLTPIFYPLEALSPKLAWLVMHFNPMYLYIHQFRCLVLYGQMWDWTFWFRGWVISILMLLIGLYSFIKKQDKFILYI